MPKWNVYNNKDNTSYELLKELATLTKAGKETIFDAVKRGHYRKIQIQNITDLIKTRKHEWDHVTWMKTDGIVKLVGHCRSRGRRGLR